MAVWWNNKMRSQIGNIFFSRRSSIICFLPSFHPSSFLPLSSFPPFLPQIHVDCLLCVSTVLSGRPAHFYLHPSGFSLWFDLQSYFVIKRKALYYLLVCVLLNCLVWIPPMHCEPYRGKSFLCLPPLPDTGLHPPQVTVCIGCWGLPTCLSPWLEEPTVAFIGIGADRHSSDGGKALVSAC